jgi:hypothetical protein
MLIRNITKSFEKVQKLAQPTTNKHENIEVVVYPVLFIQNLYVFHLGNKKKYRRLKEPVLNRWHPQKTQKAAVFLTEDLGQVNDFKKS